MITFFHDHKPYTYIPYEEFTRADLPEAHRAYKSHYLDLDCAFDIETSSDQDNKLSWMYMWQFAINDITIIGRTWEEFQEFIDIIGDFYQNKRGDKILVWDHNLNYEFSFCKKWIHYGINKYDNKDVFALSPREVIKFRTDNNIEFRDSSVLTNVKLEKLAKDYKTGLEKLVEDIDYKEVLTPKTPLDHPRLAYAINDVQILAKFNKNYIKKYYIKVGHDIPLTSTAIVRNELKRKFKALPKKEKIKFKNMIRAYFPDKEEYEIVMRWLYRGGYVHSSIADTFQKFVNMDMWSLDFKSSYPAVMQHNKYPWHFVRRSVKEWYKIAYDRRYMEDNAFYVLLRFKNIRAKTSHSIESKHKIIDYKGGYFDNGRLVKASYIEVMLTEQDWLNYQDFYKWDDVTCLSYRVASKEPLPKYLTDMVLEYFAGKESFDRDSLDYTLQKRKLNSLYGMCCSGLFHQSLILDDDGELIPSGEERDFEDIVRSQILLPWFGIWICAYARRNLLKIVAKLDTDNAYSDTDSSKVFNYYGNKYIFDNYNDRIERINKNMDTDEYDNKIFRDLGKFTLEDKYIKFQTNGCKRYIYTTADFDKEDKVYRLKDHVTIAGMRKGSLERKAIKEGREIYDLFQDGLELDKLESDKLTTSYNDEGFTMDVTDYLGETSTVTERSCVTLVDVGFKMNIEETYLQYYDYYTKRDELIVGERF